MRRFVRVAAILVAVVAVVAAMAVPASASEFHRSYTTYNGSATSLQFYESGGDVKTMTSIRLAIQLPDRYDWWCGTARLLIDGIARLSDYACAGGDGHVTYWLGTFSAYDGDLVTAWFGDPCSRYAVTHPAIRL